MIILKGLGKKNVQLISSKEKMDKNKNKTLDEMWNKGDDLRLSAELRLV